MTISSIGPIKNLEKLSSGLDINRGADGPAKLQISEQLRAQTAGLKQAIDNSEMAVSLMKTAEAALDEVNRALVQARQLAVHAANTVTNEEFMQLADLQELDNILHQINTIAANTQYGKKFLLDGSRSGNGVTTGANLEFIGGGTGAASSGPGGHAITINQAATRSEVVGLIPLTEQIINSGEVSRGYLGVRMSEVDSDLADALGMNKPYGALINDVEEGESADNAGLIPGDVIIEFDSKEIKFSSDLPHVVGQIKPNSSAKAKVIRDGKEITLDLQFLKSLNCLLYTSDAADE